MNAKRGLVVLVWGVSLTAALPSANAAQSKCLAAKNKCVAKLGPALLKCHQLAETPGKVADPNDKGCIDKALAKFNGGLEPEKGCFAKLESKAGNDCLTVNDTSSVQDAVEACVDRFVSAIDPPPLDQGKCGAGKKKCAATEFGGLLKCYQKAELPGKPSDPNTDGCIDKVRAKFDGGVEPAKGCFAKLEAKNGNDCLAPLDNTVVVGALVESCVAAVVAQLDVGTPTTTTTPTTSTTAPTTTTTTTVPTTTTTTVPTTTTTTVPTTTTTTSTTTTTLPGPVTCGPSNFLDVTATLVYEPRIVGGVFGMFLEVDYPVGVTIPGSGTAATARARFTNLIGANYRFVPQDLDTNANGVDDQGRTLVTANTTVEVPNAAIERIRFDCPSGTVVQPAQFACRPTSLSDSAGILFPPQVAALVSCSLGFAVP